MEKSEMFKLYDYWKKKLDLGDFIYITQWENKVWALFYVSVQFSSVAQSCPALYDPMICNTPGLPVYHQFPEFTQTHAHRVGDAIQPSHPLRWSPYPPVPNPSQRQGLFQWVNSLHEVAKAHTHTMEYYSAINKNKSFVICDNTDGLGGYYM